MILVWLALQVASYGYVLAIFTAIAFTSARFAGVPGLFIGHVVNAGIIVWLDVQWITSAMAQWQGDFIDGPDMDFGFFIGVVLRIFLINTLLLPVSWWALRLLRRSRSSPLAEDAIAT